ncbi:MAG: alkaline phosphatase D family protein [Anaeromyxobacteraceae bacterium]|nr:alkaline phosphatase D family protein [Anaeromyxobacteraceae bacterium]
MSARPRPAPRASALALALCLSALLGCADKATTVTFSHGVASGDPLADRVILWTRATPSRQEAVALDWQVAADASFAAVVASGTVVATPEADHTVKVDAAGLSPGTSYWYRFRHGGTASPVGRTRTLPGGTPAQVRLAVVSCANYPAGHFNVFADIAAEPGVDAVLHLGDAIYEYARGQYASSQAAALGRLVDPEGELLTLSDYRRRHAQYRTDPDYQAMLAAAPLIATWDDHEVANDAWTGGAENHTPATEGAWADRRAAAFQAYHEWMPVRLPDPARPERVFRAFPFGDLATLHVLDTRHVGRERPLDITAYLGAGGAFDGAAFAADLAADRQLLGAEQTAWLQAGLAGSSATWQLLGQQILMGRMNVPAPIALRQITVSAYAALAARAAADPASLTAAEQAILAAPAIPYNLDAWDGYAVARETVLGTARALDRNLVVLSGDTHNAWANDLDDLAGNPVGVELAGPGVSSPGLEEIFVGEDPALFAAGVAQLIGPLVWADTSRRGWLLVTATPTEVTGDWRFVSTTASRSFTSGSGKVLKVLPGAGGRRLVEP